MGSYIIGDHQVVYAQRFCDHVGCYTPHVGTFRAGKGFMASGWCFPFFLVNLPLLSNLIRAGSTTSPLIITFLIFSNIFGPSGSRGLDFVVSACFHPRFHLQELHLSPGPLQGGTPLGALPAEAAGRAARGDARRELHRALPGAAGRGAATAEGIHRWWAMDRAAKGRDVFTHFYMIFERTMPFLFYQFFPSTPNNGVASKCFKILSFWPFRFVRLSFLVVSPDDPGNPCSRRMWRSCSSGLQSWKRRAICPWRHISAAAACPTERCWLPVWQKDRKKRERWDQLRNFMVWGYPFAVHGTVEYF